MTIKHYGVFYHLKQNQWGKIDGLDRLQTARCPLTLKRGILTLPLISCSRRMGRFTARLWIYGYIVLWIGRIWSSQVRSSQHWTDIIVVIQE